MVAGISTGALFVFIIIVVALALFVSEVIPTDVTAIGVIVALAALQPWTGITHREAIAGFANPATITIVAMYMLSAGIQNTGLVQRLGIALARLTNGSETRALAATIGTTGPIAGIVNNTPVVAVFIPMITDLADQSAISPSRLLLPLSYAAILGGTLTLVGTSTNILASDLTHQLLDRGPIGMFEFTPLGLIVLVVGLAYLMTIGRWLTPARIPANQDLVEEFDLDDQLGMVAVSADSALIGVRADEIGMSVCEEIETPVEEEAVPPQEGSPKPSTDGGRPSTHEDVSILQIVRDETTFASPATDQRIEAGDRLTVHGSLQAVNRFAEHYEVRQLPHEEIAEGTFDGIQGNTLAKLVVSPDSAFAGEPLAEAKLEERHQTTVLAVKRGTEQFKSNLDELVLEPGDVVLARTTATALEYFSETGDLVLVHDGSDDLFSIEDLDERVSLSPKTPIAVAIMAGVIGVAALGWLPIVIAALAGTFAMIVTGCLTPSEAYDAVSWNIIFLLAGVIPLGMAMEATGGTALVAASVVAVADLLPLLAVLFLIYLLTGLFANVITPVATVVLMIPIAVDVATRVGANEFSFLLAVTFASATSFMTPIGYQTNLMVYGPGGYRFTDFLRVGGPLQLLLSVVTTVCIAIMWGL